MKNWCDKDTLLQCEENSGNHFNNKTGNKETTGQLLDFVNFTVYLGATGANSIYFPIGDPVKVSQSCYQISDAGVTATSRFISHHETTAKFSQTPRITFSRKSTWKTPFAKSCENEADYVNMQW